MSLQATTLWCDFSLSLRHENCGFSRINLHVISFNGNHLLMEKNLSAKGMGVDDDTTRICRTLYFHWKAKRISFADFMHRVSSENLC